MKVIHLISGGDSGGAKTHVYSLLQGLNAHMEADMVCFTDGPFAQQAQELGLRVEVMAGHNLAAVLRRLKRFVQEGGYDIIHCHGARGNLMGALLRRSTGLPVVTTVHSDPRLDYMGRFFGRLVFGSLNAMALRRIPYHIGVSDAMTDLLIQRGIAREHFFSIYNGIRFTPPPVSDDRLGYLRSLGAQVEEDSVVVGIAARLNPVKDIATLIRGFALAAAQCPRLRLVIAGDGSEMAALTTLRHELGMEDKVTFAGWIDSGMDRFYGALDVNALTSLSETFPYALTEGARFRLATVASAVGGIPNLIDDGVNGYLFTPGDHEALGRRLAALGEDDGLRRTFGQRLYEKASTQFSIEKTIDTQLDIYRRILAHRKAVAEGGRRGVVICGAYGRGNAGDEAILQAIVAEMRSIDSDMPICVMTRKPRLARQECRTQAVYTFNYPAYRKKMRMSRLYINGGGSLIQNVTSRRSLRFYLSTLSTAHRVGCKVMMYGCGIGPVSYQSDRRRAARVINRCVDAITLRDRDSKAELQALNVTAPRILLAADPTVTLPAATAEQAAVMLRQAGLEPEAGQRYLGIALRPWRGFEAKAPVIASAIAHAYYTHGLRPVFLPIEARLDVGAAQQVAAYLGNVPYTILPGCGDAAHSIALFSRMSVVLSMRLHGLIFPAVHGVPLVGIVYDPKVSSFLDLVEQDLYTPLEELEPQGLKDQLDAAAERMDDRPLLEERAGRLLALEQSNVLCARELLRQ